MEQQVENLLSALKKQDQNKIADEVVHKVETYLVNPEKETLIRWALIGLTILKPDRIHKYILLL